MPLYVFRCAACPDVDRAFSMAAVPDEIDCATCGAPARRVITTVATGADPGTTRLLDATRATADRPAVVSAIPGRTAPVRRVTTDPRHRRLPRP
ncbi:zinc ribbon domain-containing protein [uncultured Williamsia sp.]|uniref:FmdB family zinc ribbon protein n=1 Tax=uncultured Williamsia sp. TaxID=259311 RepID=UPI002616AE52|nr:zinc ribbon domain-containing protein [uncultured Williamsia sp.]